MPAKTVGVGGASVGKGGNGGKVGSGVLVGTSVGVSVGNGVGVSVGRGVEVGSSVAVGVGVGSGITMLQAASRKAINKMFKTRMDDFMGLLLTMEAIILYLRSLGSSFTLVLLMQDKFIALSLGDWIQSGRNPH